MAEYGMTYSVKTPNFYEDRVLDFFSVEVFQLSKLHENEAKLDKSNFKNILTLKLLRFKINWIIGILKSLL